MKMLVEAMYFLIPIWVDHINVLTWPFCIMPRLQIFERGRATAFLEAGVPVKEVARRLGVSPNAIRKLKAKFYH